MQIILKNITKFLKNIYNERENEILSEFSNVKINTSRSKLNDSFNALRNFLIDHFYIPNSHYEMYKNPPFFYLEPRIHHNFGGENKDPILWNRYKSELDRIAEEFEGAYKDFVKTAKKEIEQDQKEEILKISPEFYGIGINLKTFWHRVRGFFGK